jgi:hypothetical protein
VEKLARKCGFDAVQAAMPAGDSKLLTHIRKERTRKEVRKSGAAPQVGPLGSSVLQTTSLVTSNVMQSIQWQ